MASGQNADAETRKRSRESNSNSGSERIKSVSSGIKRRKSVKRRSNSNSVSERSKSVSSGTLQSYTGLSMNWSWRMTPKATGWTPAAAGG
jgi:hypothetical protein